MTASGVRRDKAALSNVGKRACIEDRPQKPAELPKVHSTPKVWCTMDNGQIVSRDDRGVLTPVARGKETARSERDRWRYAIIDGSDPP
jgi:hypothetical protein